MSSTALRYEYPTAARTVHPSVLDNRAAEMSAFLARFRPQSAAEALRILRNAFPDAPLELRVAACGLANQ
jgi:hypothetical protein